MAQIKDIITKYSVENNKKILGDSDLAILIKITEEEKGKQKDWNELAIAIKEVTGVYVNWAWLQRYNNRKKEQSVFKKFDKPFTGSKFPQESKKQEEPAMLIEELEARELHKPLGYYNPNS